MLKTLGHSEHSYSQGDEELKQWKEKARANIHFLRTNGPFQSSKNECPVCSEVSAAVNKTITCDLPQGRPVQPHQCVNTLVTHLEFLK